MHPIKRLLCASLICIPLATPLSAAPSMLRTISRGPAAAEVIDLLSELNLTAEQKQAIAKIILSHRDEIRSQIQDMQTTGRALFDAIHAADFDEQAIRQAHRQMAARGEDLAVLRARIFGELRAVLTPEQVAEVEAFTSGLLDKIRNRMGKRRQFFQSWIERNAGN